MAATSNRRGEPLWLPAGWLAVVLILSASVPALGETSGWHARRSAPMRHTVHRPTFRPDRSDELSTSGWASTAGSQRIHDSHFRPVDYADDIAGPSLRVARRSDPRDYRVAQQNEGENAFGSDLQEAIERPFGVRETPDEAMEAEGYKEADDLFDDLPADPFDEEEEELEARPSRSGAPGDRTEPADRGGYQGDYEEAAPVAPRVEPLPKPNKGRPSHDQKRAEARQQAAQDCAEGLASIQSKRLDMIDLSIGIAGTEGEDYPYACSVSDGSLYAPRCWCEVTYMWKASALCHKPLYFEDVHLERYGHSWGPYMQPLVSGAHFFGRLPVLPYCMGLKAPNECVYTLGHYRPGNCAPYLIDPIPFTWRAAMVQGAATVGVAGFLP